MLSARVRVIRHKVEKPRMSTTTTSWVGLRSNAESSQFAPGDIVAVSGLVVQGGGYVLGYVRGSTENEWCFELRGFSFAGCTEVL